LVLDARCFPDPNAKQTTGHPGVHPEILNRIVHHRRFKSYLEEVARRWRQAVAVQKRAGLELEMVVAVYCRSGKHRSVAIAECLRYIGDTVEGLRLNGEVKYLSKQRWGRMCKGGCDECLNDPDGLRQRSLDIAAEYWRRSLA
jgi:hypothetical protein